MAAYKIQVPFHASHRIRPETFIFNREQEAIDTLTNYLTQNGIDFKIKQVLKRKAFVNKELGELASVISYW